LHQTKLTVIVAAALVVAIVYFVISYLRRRPATTH